MVLSKTTSIASTNFVSGGIRRLREGIELDALAVGDGLGDVGVAAALEVGAQQGIARVGLRRQRDVALRCRLLVAGRQDEVFAALPLVDAGRSDILQRRLPGLVDAAGDRRRLPVAAGGISSTIGPTSLVLKKGIR